MKKFKIRNDEIKRLRFEEEMSLQSIADIYGVTRQRIAQIIGKSGYIPLKSHLINKIKEIDSPYISDSEMADILGSELGYIQTLRNSLGSWRIGEGGYMDSYADGVLKIKDLLTEKGFDIKLYRRKRFGYDMVVDGHTRVSCRVVTTEHNPPSKQVSRKQYKVAFVGMDADVLCIYIVPENDILLIPTKDLGDSQYRVFCWPHIPGHYTGYLKYHNNFDVLRGDYNAEDI